MAKRVADVLSAASMDADPDYRRAAAMALGLKGGATGSFNEVIDRIYGDVRQPAPPAKPPPATEDPLHPSPRDFGASPTVSTAPSRITLREACALALLRNPALAGYGHSVHTQVEKKRAPQGPLVVAGGAPQGLARVDRDPDVVHGPGLVVDALRARPLDQEGEGRGAGGVRRVGGAGVRVWAGETAGDFGAV
jgi:hypothetical protein